MYSGNFLAERLSSHGSVNREKVLSMLPAIGREVSYQKFFDNAETSASALVSLGVRPGDSVLVFADKSFSSIELFFGCLLCGAVYTPISPASRIEDLQYFVKDSRPALVVCDQKRVEAFQGIKDCPKILTINPDESGSFVDLRSSLSGFSALSRQPDDCAAVLYTSGTTGLPKGVIHTHGSLWSNAHALVDYWSFSHADVLLHVLPVFHLHGLFTAMNVVLAAGASTVFLPSFDVDSALDHMPKCTVMMGVPPYYMSLLENSSLSEAAKNIRVFISGSAPMLPQTHAAWRDKTGTMILERYGMTECSMIASNPYDGERKPNSVGFPLPGTEVRVVDTQAGDVLPAGKIGMIQIKGSNLFAGYLNKPEKTAEDMTSDGFFVSGDLGCYDSEGYLYVLGRVKDAVFTRAGIVIPKEIEELIDKAPNVVESAVISVDHPDRGSLPVAIVVGDKGRATEGDVREFVEDRLESFKQPVRYVFVDGLPRNAMGKVQKVELRKLYADLFR